MKDRIYRNYMKETGWNGALLDSIFLPCSYWENGVQQRGKWKVIHVSYTTILLCPSPGSTHFFYIKKPKNNCSYLENIRNCWLIETKMCFGSAHTNVNEWNISSPIYSQSESRAHHISQKNIWAIAGVWCLWLSADISSPCSVLSTYLD